MTAVPPVEPIRKSFFMLDRKKAFLVDVATGQTKEYETPQKAWEQKNIIDIIV